MFRRNRALESLDDDIRDHIEREVQEHIERGVSPEEARRLAMLSFGNVVRVKEDVRAVWTWPLIDEIRQDSRYAVRMLRRNPLFVAVAVLTLALGVGANTAMFTVVNAVLIRSLPYPDADRLVQLTEIAPSVDGRPPRLSSRISVSELVELRESVTSLSDLSFVAGPSLMTATGWGPAMRLQGLRVAPGYFETLAVTAHLGRTFGPLEEAPGADGVIVLSHSTWQTHFQADARVIGNTLTLANSLTPNPKGDSRKYVVVGVMPDGFDAANAGVQFWIPAQWNPKSGGSFIGRLRSGSSLSGAEAELGSRLREIRSTGPDVRYQLRPAIENIVEPIRPALLMLTGAAVFLLLIACVNVANLFLARMGSRHREITIRRALGAGRGRIIRQLLMEGVLLALAGGVAGIALAWVGVALLRSVATTLPRIDLGVQLSFPRLQEITADGTVLAFAALTSIAAGILFSLGPAIGHSRHTQGIEALRESSSTAHAGFSLFRRGRTRAVLVFAEVALAMVLLVGAGLMVNSYVKLSTVDRGFDSNNVLTFQVALPAERYPIDRVKTFAEDLVARLAGAPGVVAAAYGQLPMVVVVESALFRRTPDVPATSERGGPEIRLVSQDYLTAMGIPVVSGRGFNVQDREGTRRVLLINESLARAEFQGRHVIGAQVFVGPDSHPWEIVGVARDVRQLGLDRPAGPQVFALVSQWPGNNAFPLGPYFSIRTQSEPTRAAGYVRQVVGRLEKDASIFNVATLAEIVSNNMSRLRLYAALLGTLGVLAGILALIGIYGVLSYAVSQRTREIGIRMALGAKSGDVLRMVLGQSALVAGHGIAAGLIAAALLTGYMRGMLFGVEPLDMMTFAVVTVCFAAIAAAASYIPARRATKVDPLTALRWE